MKKLQRQMSIEETPSLRGDGLAQHLLQGSCFGSFRYNSNTEMHYLPKTESSHIMLLPLSFPEEYHGSRSPLLSFRIGNSSCTLARVTRDVHGYHCLKHHPWEMHGKDYESPLLQSSRQTTSSLRKCSFPSCLSSRSQEHWIMVKGRGAPRLRIQGKMFCCLL